MGQQRIEDIFIDYYYLNNINLSHTHSIEDKIIDKDITLLARTKATGIMIYSLYSSDQIWVPIEYINIFLGFLREDGDRLAQLKPINNIELFIVSLCNLVKSLYYNLKLGKETIIGIFRSRSKDFKKLMLERFNQSLPDIVLENIKDKIVC